MHPCVHLCVRYVCPLLARMVWSFQGCVRAFIISYVFSLLLFIFCVPLLMRVGYLCARLNCFYVYLSMVRVRVSMIFKCAPSPLSLNLSVPHLRLSLLVFVCHQPSSLHFFFCHPNAGQTQRGYHGRRPSAGRMDHAGGDLRRTSV